MARSPDALPPLRGSSRRRMSLCSWWSLVLELARLTQRRPSNDRSGRLRPPGRTECPCVLVRSRQLVPRGSALTGHAGACRVATGPGTSCAPGGLGGTPSVSLRRRRCLRAPGRSAHTRNGRSSHPLPPHQRGVGSLSQRRGTFTAELKASEPCCAASTWPVASPPERRDHPPCAGSPSGMLADSSENANDPGQ